MTLRFQYDTLSTCKYKNNIKLEYLNHLLYDMNVKHQKIIKTKNCEKGDNT